MRRSVVILAGLLAAVLAYFAVYFIVTAPHRVLMESPAPELAWLKQEFHLTDAEFKRISDLHAGYLPRCGEMCQRIANKNAEIKELIGSSNASVAAIEQKLAEASQLRLQCQTNMLHHFIAVSRQMPPEQGRRYLLWIEERTLLDSGGMMARHQADNAEAGHATSEPEHHQHH